MMYLVAMVLRTASLERSVLGMAAVKASQISLVVGI